MARGAQDGRRCVEDDGGVVEDVGEEAKSFGIGEEGGAQEVCGNDRW